MLVLPPASGSQIRSQTDAQLLNNSGAAGRFNVNRPSISFLGDGKAAIMAVNDHLIRNEMEIQSGQTLVRRFTDGLVGVTTIERAAISVKPQSNELASTKAEFQVRRLLQDDENGLV